MHPLIRVLCFLVLSAAFAFGGAGGLWCGAILLLLAYAMRGRSHLGPAVRMAARLRWFYLSLAIVYGWFTPGTPLWAAPEALVPFLPTVEGLAAGAGRLLALVLIVFAVNLLLRTSSREELLAAIHGLARPLGAFGVSRDRLALRLVLVMESLDAARARVTGGLARRPRTMPGPRMAGAFVAGMMNEVIRDAERRHGETVVVPLGRRPSAIEWAWPLLLAAVLAAAGKLAI